MPSAEWLDKVDALVAEKVMQWMAVDLKPPVWGEKKGWAAPEGAPDFGWKCTQSCWHPTRYREQAMMVFERCEWMSMNHSRKPGLYEAGEWGDWAPTYTPETYTEAENGMLAICLASLKKAGVEVPADA